MLSNQIRMERIFFASTYHQNLILLLLIKILFSIKKAGSQTKTAGDLQMNADTRLKSLENLMENRNCTTRNCATRSALFARLIAGQPIQPLQFGQHVDLCTRYHWFVAFLFTVRTARLFLIGRRFNKVPESGRATFVISTILE